MTDLEIGRLLDRQQRLKAMPHAAKAKRIALRYLIEKVERDRDYSEREVNETLQAWHTFGDHARLRRELCDAGLLRRLDDGSRYWRVEEDGPQAGA